MRSIEPIAKFDLAFSLFCLQHKFCLPISKVSRLVSKTGDGHLYAVLGGMAWWFDGDLGRLFLIAGMLAFALELPIYWLTKNLFKRRRPQELSSLIPSFITPSDRYSLPSGHTAAAFAMATLIAQFYPTFAVLSFVWAGLIALSRILLGVHFLTDVVLGALLGLACATASLQWLGFS
ncbi:phosphatase PAP2 family protein [Vibrio sp. LaRot3]|uniref:phosphatase PAP2 family protein n=1 Tax=Vibrio sp. LaRot3 TaxID=2998829 RepID=UPI0022CDC46D|nr:phosphatase PAP2 family protein [Vibrio sp. LaRot3]MDA0149680.1 phosphatase PAP2 family protein [Vibrio sp. LaRot3]